MSSASRTVLRRLILHVFCSLPIAVTAMDDPRLAADADSPEWLVAVGRLQVPGHRHEEGEEYHHIERCSATLVSRPGASQADHIITAWHCLEWYDDLSQPIQFTLSGKTRQVLQRSARPLKSGGAMDEDWALLRLLQPIPLGGEWLALPLDRKSATRHSSLWMAGYSRKVSIGAQGTLLTYHADCRVTAESGPLRDTDCRADKGASGGAVIRLDSRGNAHLAGIISAGDGQSMTRYVPIARFVSALPADLRESATP